jgi:hypothetical protein
MRSRLSQMVLAIAAAMLLAGWTTLALAKDDKFEARQHGYEHGYRDGYHHGREDRERHAKYDFKSEDYKEGDRGYGKHMGDEDEYKKGYRTGYEAGYGDAYYRRPGRFAEIYGREDDFERRRERDVTIFEVRPEGYPDIGYDNGYRDGIRAGQKDLRDREDFDPADQSSYRDGDRGYRSSYGDIEVYKRYYREGFMRGYQDGYGRWR